MNPAQCIGCGYCETGCPFDVPQFSAKTGKMAKCTLCVDRVSVGLEPACIKACPTGCLHFGTKEDMVALGNQRVATLKAQGYAQAALYDPHGRRRHRRRDGPRVTATIPSGTAASRRPRASRWRVTLWKKWLRPIGFLAIFGAIVGAFGHHLYHGNKGHADPGPVGPGREKG